MRAKVCALYLEGKSVKDIGKIIGRNQALPAKWIKQAGLLRSKRDQVQLRYGQELYYRHQRNAFREEQRMLQAMDEHWGNHPEYKKFASLRYYYANHESRKAKGRKIAKAYYRKNKSNPEYKTRKRIALAQWRLKNPKPKSGRRAATPEDKAARRAVRNQRRRFKEIMKCKNQLTAKSMIGCSPMFLRNWLEAQFRRGMSWRNYGKVWCIDHIIPCAAHDLSNMAEIRKCFHYSNLRPLWFSDNSAKGAKIIPTQPELCMAI